MKIHHLSEKNCVLNHFLGELRDHNFQKDRLRFRRNLERNGEIQGLATQVISLLVANYN
jgi:uracil phosphoribosyltransferase